jgi:asparagine synthase (glutamine-hydrolysing)
MCGIVGILANNKNNILDIHDLVYTLKHRGPDGDDIFTAHNPYIALGHTRLSIIDLTRNGSQPKASSTGRYVISFNGEIYNHLKLRQDIEKKLKHTVNWVGASDTETLLMCFESFGIRETLEKLMGMFAISVWDRKNKEVTLIRDRFGEKPLYFSKFGSGSDSVFVFSSGIDAIKKHRLYSGNISDDALLLYHQYNYIPYPYTIYENIFKLNSGNLLTVKYRDGEWKTSELIEVEWAKPSSINENLMERIEMAGEKKTILMLDDLLTEVVEDYCLSDVPIGSFLSGGIDSTLISSIMNKVSNNPINTFTIGSGDNLYDESKHAKQVAKHLGTNHHELILSPSDVVSVAPELGGIYDEPFADSSQIPMVLLSRFVKPHVSVSLCGDGGDEIFGGYNRYVWGSSIYNFINRIPLSLRGSMGHILNSLSQDRLQHVINRSSSILPRKISVSLPSDKLRKISAAIHSRNHIEMYKSLVQVSNASLIMDKTKNISLDNYENFWDDNASFAKNAMITDRKTYLTDDILVKTDRATMSVGLENRSPFLDYRILTFADSLPDNYKIRGKQGKWILKQLLDRYVPNSLTNRPKTGFSIPIGSWLRGPLREWASDLLSKDNINKYGYFDHKYVDFIWKSHLSGKEMHNELWNILMLQNWLEFQKK